MEINDFNWKKTSLVQPTDFVVPESNRFPEPLLESIFSMRKLLAVLRLNKIYTRVHMYTIDVKIWYGACTQWRRCVSCALQACKPTIHSKAITRLAFIIPSRERYNFSHKHHHHHHHHHHRRCRTCRTVRGDSRTRETLNCCKKVARWRV